MYSYNLSLKKLKDYKHKTSKKLAENRWLRNYHEQIQPKLLEHYDARVNAFIKRVEDAPQKVRMEEDKDDDPFKQPWKFALSSRSQLGNKFRSKTEVGEGYEPSIWHSSAYIPLGNHQFRQRDKTREIRMKSTANQLLYKKYKEVRKVAFRTQETAKAKLQQPLTFRKQYEDNRSDVPSVTEDNVSLRHSVNSQMDNIQKEALQYQKNLEIVQKKNHFKRLANLQVTVSDKRAKKSIYSLLVKQGKIKSKRKHESEQAQTDLLKAIMQKGLKLDGI